MDHKYMNRIVKLQRKNQKFFAFPNPESGPHIHDWNGPDIWLIPKKSIKERAGRRSFKNKAAFVAI